MTRADVEQRRQRNEAIEQLLGDRVICTECGARLADFDSKCSAALDVACQGFTVIEAALAKVKRSPAR